MATCEKTKCSIFKCINFYFFKVGIIHHTDEREQLSLLWQVVVQKESMVSAAAVMAEVIKALAPEKEIPKVMGPDSAAL